jgi:hypothetical protein
MKRRGGGGRGRRGGEGVEKGRRGGVEKGGGIVTLLARAVIFHLPSHNDHFFTPSISIHRLSIGLTTYSVHTSCVFSRAEANQNWRLDKHIYEYYVLYSLHAQCPLLFIVVEQGCLAQEG